MWGLLGVFGLSWVSYSQLSYGSFFLDRGHPGKGLGEPHSERTNHLFTEGSNGTDTKDRDAA